MSHLRQCSAHHESYEKESLNIRKQNRMVLGCNTIPCSVLKLPRLQLHSCPASQLLHPGTVLFIFLYFTPCLTFSLRLMVTHRLDSCDHLLYRLVTRYVPCLYCCRDLYSSM